MLAFRDELRNYSSDWGWRQAKYTVLRLINLDFDDDEAIEETMCRITGNLEKIDLWLIASIVFFFKTYNVL